MKGCFMCMKNTKINVLLFRYPMPYPTVVSVWPVMCILRSSDPVVDSLRFLFPFCCTNKLHRCVL